MNVPPRKKRNSSRVNLMISAVFHTVLIGGLFYFAAREGFLGKTLKTIAVQMAPKEKPPEKKPEPKKPEEPKVTQQKVEPKAAPKIVETARVAPPPTVSVAPPSAAPPSVAPPVVDVGTFNFTDDSAKTVQSSGDPVMIYKGLIEYAVRSRWNRPENMADSSYVAEVNLTIDQSGKIANVEWQKGSGDTRWDDSVKRALKEAVITRPPPKNFPSKIVVRFDTQEETEPASTLGQP
jgi:TonB family protein